MAGETMCGAFVVPNAWAAQGGGVWESSGIVDADHVIGKGTFLLDVQAHRGAALVPADPDYGKPLEDGQLGVLWPTK